MLDIVILAYVHFYESDSTAYGMNPLLGGYINFTKNLMLNVSVAMAAVVPTNLTS